MNTQANTAQQIIEIAIGLMIERGYNAFSYADISERMEIRKASIHYHFPNNSDLGRSVVAYYLTLSQQGLNQIHQITSDPGEKLNIYTENFYRQMTEAGFFSRCTHLVTELPTLPECVRDQ